VAARLTVALNNGNLSAVGRTALKKLIDKNIASLGGQAAMEDEE